MGLPAEWVIDPRLGLTHAQQLVALGNGVVPQQATRALEQLREGGTMTMFIEKIVGALGDKQRWRQYKARVKALPASHRTTVVHRAALGELAALRVKRVDLRRRRLLIAESVTEVNGKAVSGTPKTHHHRRSVPLPRFLVDPLKDRVAGRHRDDLVFTSPDCEVLHNNNFRRRVFDRAARDAGLAGLTLHELRHTAASLAVAEGANVKAVQRMLGHASAAMTLDVYADLFEDDLDRVADRLDRVATRMGADSLRTDPLSPAFDAVSRNRRNPA
jgi:hypothetical protein